MASVQVENKKNKRTKGKDTDGILKKRILKPEIRDLSPETILKKYRDCFMDNNHLIDKAKQGLDISAVYDFAILSGKSQKEIAELIHSTAKTVQNYRAVSKKLPTLQSELLLKLFALYDKGLGIFQDAESFNSWLQKPAFGLYNDIPYTLLFTATGINLVMDELIRIEYGDLA